jgi:hypothetical protein
MGKIKARLRRLLRGERYGVSIARGQSWARVAWFAYPQTVAGSIPVPRAAPALVAGSLVMDWDCLHYRVGGSDVSLIEQVDRV